MNLRAMSAGQIIEVWEQGLGQHEIDRALTILAAVSPGLGRAELAALTVGQRDSQLLRLREMTFGNRLDCFSACPQCGECLQFSLTTESLQTARPRAEEQEMEFRLDEFMLRFRLPDSCDLAAVVNCPETGDPHRLILQQCLTEVLKDGRSTGIDDLPENVVDAISSRIAAWDPRAEILLELNCSSCSHQWTSIFDIVSFFWKEISAHAKRLLEEVVILSRAYGWRETDILELGPVRRRFYLNRAT